MASRAERLALNEAAFRVANQRARQWDERHEQGQAELYLCECADLGCPARVELTQEAYEGVRDNSLHFFCAPGHETPDVETVIERHEHYVVVEKGPEVAELVTETDPTRD